MTAALPLRPLAALDAAPIRGVLTDIDDTLTTRGRLTADAYVALERLAAAGIAVVPVTGRSAGWAHMVIKTWPVAAVVAESGGLYLHRDAASGRLLQRFHDDEARVRADRARLARCAEQVLREVPGLAPASDNAYRLVDLALDWCEEVPRLPREAVDRAIALFRTGGFCARASSVHVNAWAGDFDKGPTALACLRECFGVDDEAARAHWLFVGDAPNDASMFERFPHSVGVANLLESIDALAHRPGYVTQRPYGEGFVELVDHLLSRPRRRLSATTRRGAPARAGR